MPKKNNNCSICGNKFDTKISLGSHPCADTFLKKQKAAVRLKKIPLEVGFCKKCSHMTSIHLVSGYVRYQKHNYSYTSDNSPVSNKHFKNLAKKISNDLKLNKKNLVVEAGSNDGTFLKEINLISKSKVVGIDPSPTMTRLSKRRKVKTFQNFFGKNFSSKLKKKIGLADLFYAANVFNHVDSPKDFLEGVKRIIKDKGLVVIEVPDLSSLIKNIGFDTIYHEHRNYFSLFSIQKIFKNIGLKIIKVEKIPYMAGSLRIYSKKDPKVKNKVYFDKKFSIKDINTFRKNIKIVIKKMLEFVREKNLQNKLVVGLGAATKGNTLLNMCRFNSQDIHYILEKSPHKIGKFTPGSGIPIISEELATEFDAVIVLPWNISKYLLKKFKIKNKNSFISIQKVSSNLKNV